MKYKILYNNITHKIPVEEAALIDAVFREELKAIRLNDIDRENDGRPLIWVNRNALNLHTGLLDSLNWIEDDFALYSVFNCLNYIIDHISPINRDKTLALGFIGKCFQSGSSSSEIIVRKIDKILKFNPHLHNGSVLGLLTEFNYGNGVYQGLKYFEPLDNEFLREIRTIYRAYNTTPVENVEQLNNSLKRVLTRKRKLLVRHKPYSIERDCFLLEIDNFIRQLTNA